VNRKAKSTALAGAQVRGWMATVQPRRRIAIARWYQRRLDGGVGCMMLSL